MTKPGEKSAFSYSYAFFLTVLASLLAVAGGVMVALGNRATSELDRDLDIEEVGRAGSGAEVELVKVTAQA